MMQGLNSQIVHSLVVIIVVCSLIQCAMPTTNTSIYYSDQNNNSYTITSNTLVYSPIKAIESSSGTYDGGEPASVSLSKEQFEEILNSAKSLSEDSSKHTEQRQMMTAILQMKDQTDSKRMILRKSSARTLFEALLRAAIDSN